WSRLTFYLLDLTNERSTTFPAQPAKPFASRLTTYCDEPDEMGLRLNCKGDEDAKSFRKNLDWPHYFCTGGHHFQALRNSSGNPAALWWALSDQVVLVGGRMARLESEFFPNGS